MADNENKEEVSKSNTDQRIKNYLAISDIKKYLDVYWTDKKLGKHKTMKEKHGELILKNMKVTPDELFKSLKNNKFKLGNFGPSKIDGILKNSKLHDDLDETYIKDSLAVTTTRPSIGKGEFLFASLFGNIGFSTESGDLIDLKTDEKIECKGKRATLGNGQGEKFKSFTKSLMFSILKYLKINDISPEDLKTDYVQILKKRIGNNEKALTKVFIALQNLNDEYEPLGAQCLELYKEKKQFLRVIAACHLYTYMSVEKADYLLALNDKKFMMFIKPTNIQEAYSIIENFDIHGWSIGDFGVKVTLK